MSHGIEVCPEGEGMRGHSGQRPAPMDGLEEVHKSISVWRALRRCVTWGRGLETG